MNYGFFMVIRCHVNYGFVMVMRCHVNFFTFIFLVNTKRIRILSVQKLEESELPNLTVSK